MLQLVIPAAELWDEDTETFIQAKEQTLRLEHSLVSLSKWESRWNKPFLSDEPKTTIETLDYIRCMTVTQNVSPDAYSRITDADIRQVSDYIEAPMTATKIEELDQISRSRKIITSEIIYYWMISMNIPFECEKWHINRLLTLIRVCSIMNQPQKKMSAREIMERNADLNAKRRREMHSNG